MSNNIVLATNSDREQLMTLYKEQVGREFCAWDEDYPSTETIDFDLSRDALFVMKENDAIIAAISIEIDEDVDRLECWDRNLFPGGRIGETCCYAFQAGYRHSETDDAIWNEVT